MHLLQLAGLLNTSEAGHDRVEEVQKNQGGILIEVELAVPGLVACAGVVLAAVFARAAEVAAK